MCHRNEAGGWVRDKRIRDAGPWIGTFSERQMERQVLRHACAGADLVLAANVRVAQGEPAGRRNPSRPAPVPDGAMMIKEMYSTPAAACAGVDIDKLLRDEHIPPPSWCATPRARTTAGSGAGTAGPDRAGRSTGRRRRRAPTRRWALASTAPTATPRRKTTPPSRSLKNIEGEPGEPLVFLSQNFFLDPSWQSLQMRIQNAGAKDAAERRQRSRLQPGLHPHLLRRSAALPAARPRDDGDAAGDL